MAEECIENVNTCSDLQTMFQIMGSNNGPSSAAVLNAIYR